MAKVRSLVFAVLFPLLTAVCCIFLAFGPLLPRKACLAVAFVWLRLVSLLERSVLRLDYRVAGRENLPAHGSFILASKHQSTYETMKLHLLLGDPAIVMKRELLRLPIWGSFARKTGMIPIERGAGRVAMEEMLTAARKAVAEERPIVIFPQGTRVAPGAHRAYKIGTAVLYAELGVPIVPMALDSGLFWPKHGMKHGGTVTFSFLPPIAPGLGQEAVTALLEQRLEAETDRLIAAQRAPPKIVPATA